ncbi:hypothetical protein [Pseudomonas sp. JUb52]|uniref:hypothetical protein n=1 Tax=Pseudomonas sp. JUb52 TaxID=2485127 RepID=UPI00104940A6|nr:hypothetical protein [Pseudomonas sp. JUb52]
MNVAYALFQAYLNDISRHHLLSVSGASCWTAELNAWALGTAKKKALASTTATDLGRKKNRKKNKVVALLAVNPAKR